MTFLDPYLPYHLVGPFTLVEPFGTLLAYNCILILLSAIDSPSSSGASKIGSVSGVSIGYLTLTIAHTSKELAYMIPIHLCLNLNQ